MAQSNSPARRNTRRIEAVRRSAARDYSLAPGARWNEIAQAALEEKQKEEHSAMQRFFFEIEEEHGDWQDYQNRGVQFDPPWNSEFEEPYPDDYYFELSFRDRDEVGMHDNIRDYDWWHERHPLEPIMGSHNL